MPETIDPLAARRPYEILATASAAGETSPAERELCKLAFLSGTPADRFWWFREFFLSEDVVVHLLEDANRVELNRIGTALLDYRTPPNTKQGPFGRRSERVLRAALERAAGGGGNKLFAAQLCYEIDQTPLREVLFKQAPETLDQLLTRALGGQRFVDSVHKVGSGSIAAVISLYRALHGFSVEEVDRIVTVLPTSKELNTSDWSAYVTRQGQNLDPQQLISILAKHIGGVSLFFRRKVMSMAASANISAVLSENLDLCVLTSDQYAPLGSGFPLESYRQGTWASYWNPNGTVLDSPLALFRTGYTPERLSWVFSLWVESNTGPSVDASVGAMFSQPDLMPLVFTGPSDGSGDSKLLAAAEFAAPRLSDQSTLVGITNGSPYWMREAAARILAEHPVRSPLLRNFLTCVAER